MAKVRIVTDSSAELPPEALERWEIEVAPLRIQLGEEVYREGVDITSREILRRLEHTSTLPVSLPPSAQSLQQIYSRLSRATDQIISIHMSSKISDTLRVVHQALEPTRARCRIVPFDSSLISAGLGLAVLFAAQAAEEGADIEEIIRLLRGVIPHIYVVFFVEKLEYLERGGYLTTAQSILGSMLNIKPLLIVEDGQLQPLEKVKGRPRALERLAEFIVEFSHIEKVTLLYSTAQREVEELESRVRVLLPGKEVNLAMYGASVATHIGPQAVGAMVYEGRG